MTDTPAFGERLRAAAEWAAIVAVKYGILLVVFGYLLLTLLGDYNVTRGRAYNGQRAWETLEQIKAQQPQPKAEKP